MPKVPTRWMQMFSVLLMAALACTYPPRTPTPTPANQLPPTSIPSGLPADTATLPATSASTLAPTSTATLVSVLPPTQNLLGCAGYQDSYSCAQAGCLWARADGRCRNKTKACAQNKTQGSCASAGCSWNFKFKSCY